MNRADGAGRQPEEQKGLVGLRQTNPHHREGAHQQKPRISQPRPHAVTEPPYHQAHQDRDRHGGDDGVADLLLRQLQLIAHQGHQGRDAKPGQKAEKERHPREMKHSRGDRVQVE